MKKINKEQLVMGIIIGLVCIVLICVMFVQFKTVEETDITAIENMKEDELRTTLSEWKTKYEETYGIFPSDEELMKILDVKKEQLKIIKNISIDTISLSSPIGEDEEDELGNFIEDKTFASPIEEADKTSVKEELYEAISEALNPKEQKVIILRFGLDGNRARTLAEVGKELNVTRERIRQVESKALRKLEGYYRLRKTEANYNVILRKLGKVK